MIVKIRSNSVPDDTWEFFDGARQVRKIIHNLSGAQGEGPKKPTAYDYGSIGVRDDVHDFTNRPCTEDEAYGGKLELWLYGKDKDDIKQILCFRPVYLINDEGKTIEKF